MWKQEGGWLETHICAVSANGCGAQPFPAFTKRLSLAENHLFRVERCSPLPPVHASLAHLLLFILLLSHSWPYINISVATMGLDHTDLCMRVMCAHNYVYRHARDLMPCTGLSK